MSKVGQPYRCDICGKLRETDANHWLVISRRPLLDEEGRYLANGEALVIEIWDMNRAEAEGMQHICGQACALKLVERELPKLTAGGKQS